MRLPEWTPDGTLPPGIHPATMADVYDRMVVGAPSDQRSRREVAFHGLAAWQGLVRDLVPSGKMWIDGGFAVTYDATSTSIDVLVLPEDWARLETLDHDGRQQMYGLLTLEDVIVANPGPMWLDRVPPVGRVLDGYIARPEERDTYEPVWASVYVGGVRQDGQTKGFVEVSWS